METAVVRKQITDTIERARRTAHERRSKADAARAEFEALLDRVIAPLCRQVAGALKAAGYPFTVHTPTGAVRLSSDRSADDYVELSLETDAADPYVIGHTRRTWGRRVLDTDRPVRQCRVADVTEDDVLAFLLAELEPFVER